MSLTEEKMDNKTEAKFDCVITSQHKWYDFKLKELIQYKDLIFLLVRRTFVAQYKQTVLGPAWAIIKPLFTTVIFTIIFGNIAGLAPSGVPAFVFYLIGSIAWNYFAGCFTQTSTTFTTNSAILGKVYFPRLVMPITTVLSELISFGIQFLFMICFCIYYVIRGEIHPNIYLLFTPLLVLELALLGLGFGVIVSALTTKYRDLVHLISFGIQLWMYATPVAYDVSIIPEKYMSIYMLNPVSPVINTFRYAYLGVGNFQLGYYLISWAETLLVLFIGIILFNRVEKNFMDTV